MEVLNVLLSVTIYSGVIFAATMLVKKLLKNKMSPVMHFAVWAVLLARLLVPVTIESPMHLFTLPAQEQQAAPAATAPQVMHTAMPDTGSIAVNAPAVILQQTVYDVPTTAAEDTPAAQPQPGMSLPDVLLTVWLAGIGAFGLYLAAAYIALLRETRRHAAQPSKRLAALFEEGKGELGITGRVRLVCQYRYGMPALMFPGTVLMPFDALAMMDDEQIRFVLRHELTHYQRKDHLVSVLLSLLLAVYWFNPFVWLAFRQIHLDMETACDSAVVRRLDVPARSRYAALIVSLFAQPRHKAAVLGAAQGDAKKIAERRVRGIFMDEKSRRGVKLVSVLLAAVLFATCFTTACQPVAQAAAQGVNTTAQQASSVQVSESPKADASEAPAPVKTYNASKTYNDTVVNGNHTLVFNAAVEVPEAAAYPVYGVQSAPFTQAEADTFAKVLMQGKTLTNNVKPQTKAQLKKVLQDIKDQDTGENIGKNGKDQWGRTKEDLDQQKAKDIANLENLIKTAPDSVPDREIVDSTLVQNTDGSSRLDVSADLGKAKPATMSLLYSPMGATILQFRNGNEYLAETGSDTPVGLQTTQEEAIAAAEKTVRDMGYAKEFAVSAATAGSSIGNSEEDVDKLRNVQGYTIIFTRRVNNIPFTYEFIQQIGIKDPSGNPPQNFQTWQYERIIVCVDDTGVTAVQYWGKMHVTDPVNQNAALLPFEDVIKTFRQQVFDRFNLTNPANKNPQSPVKSTFIIKRITLGYTRVKNQQGESLLVPVWDFFGSMQNGYDLEAIKKDFKDRGVDKKTTDICMENYDKIQNQEQSMRYNSFLTINALDGSIIDRIVGY